jgi:hypothetical protein
MLIDLLDDVWIHFWLFLGVDFIYSFLLFNKILLGDTVQLSLEDKVFLKLLNLAIVIECFLITSDDIILFVFNLLLQIIDLIFQIFNDYIPFSDLIFSSF